VTKRNKKILQWIFIACLTLLIHALFLSIPYSWNTAAKPQVAFEMIDSSVLKSIKKNMKFSPELEESPQEKPRSADYYSDQNRQVTRQQKTLGSQSIFSGKGSHLSKAKKLPKLSQFAFPFHLQTPETQPTPQKESAQAYLDDPLPVGAETLLNTQESTYYSFFSRIRNNIAPIWLHAVDEILFRQGAFINPGEYTTLVASTLDAQGHLLRISVLKSSGVQEFDQALIESFEQGQPFVHPPSGLLDANHQSTITWSSKIQFSKNTGFTYSPPHRLY